LPAPDLAHEVFLEPDLGQWTHLPSLDQLTLRGGICGWATKATPPSPKSARQTAFQVASSAGSLPASSLEIGGNAVTMLSIMKPVLGTPTGTGVGPIGGMATQTPSEDVLEGGVALVLVDQDEPARIGQALDAIAPQERRGTPGASSRSQTAGYARPW
jgi:hypothetical protein